MNAIEPKRVEEGWFTRTLLNSVKLVLRAPIVSLIVYIGLPLTTYFFPSILIAMLIAAATLYVGTITAFKQNIYQSFSLLYIVKEYTKHYPWFTVLCCLSVMLVLLNMTSSGNSLAETNFTINDNNWLFRFSIGYMSLIIGILMITFPLWFIDATLNNIRIARGKPVKRFLFFSIFAVHLTIEHNLTWLQACDYGDKGFEKNTHVMFVFLPLAFVASIVPALLCILIPWLYCIYNEIFNHAEHIEEALHTPNAPSHSL